MKIVFLTGSTLLDNECRLETIVVGENSTTTATKGLKKMCRDELISLKRLGLKAFEQAHRHIL